jgi:sec-independent protein translocase protein TatC
MSLGGRNNIIEPLRKKIIHLATILAITVIISYPFTDRLIRRIQTDQLPDAGVKLIYITPLEGIFLKIKISLIIGLLTLLPIITYLLYQAAKKRFNLPSLKKTTITLYLITALALFLLGTIYAYEFIIPLILQYLYTNAASTGIESLWTIYKFIYFITNLTILFGVVFELPLIIVTLVKLQITEIKTLTYYRRHAYVVLFIIAALITPPDVLSQIIIALPSILLYETGLIAAKII